MTMPWRSRYSLRNVSVTLQCGSGPIAGYTSNMGVLNVTPDSFSDGGQLLSNEGFFAIACWSELRRWLPMGQQFLISEESRLAREPRLCHYRKSSTESGGSPANCPPTRCHFIDRYQYA